MKKILQKLSLGIICFIGFSYQVFAAAPIIVILKATAISTTSVEGEDNFNSTIGTLNSNLLNLTN